MSELDAKFCEHTGHTPLVCTCPLECYCRGRGCPLSTFGHNRFDGRTLAHMRELPAIPRAPDGFAFVQIDRAMELYRELAKAAIQWALADRLAAQCAERVTAADRACREHVDHFGVDVRSEEMRKRADAERHALWECEKRVRDADDRLHRMAEGLITELEETK